MKTFAIRNWHALYDVSEKGHPWHEGATLRRKPLEWVHFRVSGASWSTSYRAFLAKSGEHAAAHFGVFAKLLELSADQERDRRGAILNGDGTPADARSIAMMTGFAVSDIERALMVLTDPAVRWLEWDDSPHAPLKERKEEERREEERRESPGIPGNAGTAGKSRQRKPSSAPTGAAPPLPISKDPLKSLPRLAAVYPKIRAAILAAHPKARLPEEGTAAELADREELARLVRLDGYSEADVLDTLGWVLKADDHEAAFWRSNFRAFGPLRKVKDGASKFTKMYEAMVKATAGGNGRHDDGSAAEAAMLGLMEGHGNV